MKVSSESSALIVVDVQRDFCPGGALPVPDCDRILPVLNRYVAGAVELAMPVYASRDWHPAVTTHFRAYGGEWVPHSVQGTAGAEFHPGLKLPANAIIISKGDDPQRPGYSAFDGRTADGTPLLEHLRASQIDHLYVTGLATEYCVKQTTLDARRAGLRVTVLTDAIGGLDLRPGDTKKALAEMSRAGAELVANLGMLRRQVGGSRPTPRRPPDIVLLATEWQPRAMMRAQLVEEHFEVVATDTWPMMRRHLRPGNKPRLALVDLKGLPEPLQILNDLCVLMKPERVLVLTALGTVPEPAIERLGVRVLSRPIVIANIVRAARDAIRLASPPERRLAS